MSNKNKPEGRELDLKGAHYVVGKLTPMAQFHLGRRIAPILATMGISFGMLREGTKMDIDDLMASIGPVSVLLSNMRDEEVEYIIVGCFAAIKRKSGDYWAPCMSGVTPMFDDMDLGVIVRLCIETLRFNLSDFLKGLGEVATSPSS